MQGGVIISYSKQAEIWLMAFCAILARGREAQQIRGEEQKIIYHYLGTESKRRGAQHK